MTPLHVHSNYSLLKGTARISELIEECKINSIPAIALTDINGMYGLIQFSKIALEAGIKPILGTYINEPNDENRYVLFLAKDNSGYSDICKIITLRKLNDDFSLLNILKKQWLNLIIITPCIELLKIVEKSNSVYAEIIPTKLNKKKARKLYQYAIENNFPLAASNPIYFLRENDFLTHKVVTAIRLNTAIDNIPDVELIDQEYYFKSKSEMINAFIKIPEAIKNTILISNQCNVDLKLAEFKYPKYPAVKPDTPSSLLQKISYKGLLHRYKNVGKKELSRLEYELSVIKELNFENYFLIVWDIVQEAKRRGMMTIGRGSAANSLVAFCLELTQVDPIKHNLYFERFLNKARSSPPDVDLDFSWKERDEIVKYVFEKYGYENVAMISTMITFKARSAFREVAKAFGITNEEISTISKKIPWTNANNLPNIASLFPESKSLNFSIEPWKTIAELSTKVANFPRHLSIHPGGIVITPTKITNYCALEYAKNKGLGLIITQPDMYSVEDLGLIKIDLLSQRSLGVLRDSMDSIKKNYSK